MNTSDWAIVISLCSLGIALAGFVWNIWSKFIFPKPRLVVSFQKMVVVQGGRKSQPHISVTVVNHGPIKTKLHCVVMQERDNLFAKKQWAMLSPINNFPVEPYESNGPFSGGLPKDLEVGQSFSLYFPYERNAEFLAGPLTKIGVSDIFDVNHWARRKQVQAVINKFRADFPDTPRRKAGESARDSALTTELAKGVGNAQD